MSSQRQADLDTTGNELPSATRPSEQKVSTTRRRFFIRRSGSMKVSAAFILSLVATILLGTFAMAAAQFNPTQNGVIYSCYQG